LSGLAQPLLTKGGQPYPWSKQFQVTATGIGNSGSGISAISRGHLGPAAGG
jgi:hypothetical protein